MNGLRFWLLAVLLLMFASAALAANGDPDPFFQSATKFTYWSDVTDGVYWWAVRNESPTVTLISWTTGASFPIGTIPRATIIPEATFPLPTVQPTLSRPWFNAFLDSDLAPRVVESTIMWSDMTSVTVPVYMPPDAPIMALQNVVPEPSSSLALICGLAAVIATGRRGRR